MDGDLHTIQPPAFRRADWCERRDMDPRRDRLTDRRPAPASLIRQPRHSEGVRCQAQKQSAHSRPPVGARSSYARRMDDYWIKALGMGARQQQMPNNWAEIGNGLFHREVTSGVRPGMRTGDGIVYYASGIGLVFAVGEVTSFPFPFDDPEQPHWPWRARVKLTHWRDFIPDGVPLEALNVEKRDLRQSIKRRSHIRLSQGEYQEALRLLS